MILQLLAAALIPDKPNNCGTGQSSAYNPQGSPNCLTNLPNVAANHDQGYGSHCHFTANRFSAIQMITKMVWMAR